MVAISIAGPGLGECNFIRYVRIRIDPGRRVVNQQRTDSRGQKSQLLYRKKKHPSMVLFSSFVYDWSILPRNTPILTDDPSTDPPAADRPARGSPRKMFV